MKQALLPRSVGLEGCKRETVEVVLSCGKMGKVSTVEGGLLFDVVKTNGWEKEEEMEEAGSAAAAA